MSAGRICDAVPWHELALFGTACLLLGLLIGFVWGRASSTRPSGGTMSARLRETYDRWAPALFGAVAVLALIGIWIGTASTITNARQDEQRARENAARDHYNAALLKCFDDFATDLTATLPPVRTATVNRDTAQAERDAALNDLVKALLTRDQDQIKASFAALRATGERLVDAQSELTRTRAANPYPAAPSTFCNPAAK